MAPDMAPDMAPGRVADTGTRRSIHSAHTADHCNQSARRRDHGKHLGLAEYIYRGPRGLGQHIHLLYLLIVQHIHCSRGFVAAEVAAALEAGSMAVSTSLRSLLEGKS
jgi:hypothetical protein